MDVAIVTGSAGLIGSESVVFLANKFDLVIGIDNNMRAYFFGDNASVKWNQDRLKKTIKKYVHESIDIRNFDKLEVLFKKYQSDLKCIIHTAAQPSHDWAAKEPLTDFSVNATGTINLLECMRLACS